MMAAMARHDLITVAILFRAGKTRNHYAVCLDGRYRFLHFGVVPHLKRMGAECVEWMHFGKLQIDQLSFLHRTGRSGWLRRRLFRGRSRIFGWGLFGFRGSFNLRSLFPTSGQFVSLSRRGLAGAALSALGGRPLRGFAASLPAGSAFPLLEDGPDGPFSVRHPQRQEVPPAFSPPALLPPPLFYLGPGCLPLFIHQLIDFVKGHHHITGLGWAGPSCWGVGAAVCSGAGAWGSSTVTGAGASGNFSSPGPVFNFFICHSLSSFS